MQTISRTQTIFRERQRSQWGYLAGLSLWLYAAAAFDLHAGQAPAIFSTPEQAVNALEKAVNQTNRAVFLELFGPAAEQLTNPDSVQGTRELAEFAAAFNVTNRLSRISDTRMSLEVGTDGWPFPVPLVRTGDGWAFDTASGMDEILNRRIGRNELDMLRVIRAYVQAQREYASRDRDGDDVLEYAQRLASQPGKTDGLYWPPWLNGEISPFGPLVAYAQAEGYVRHSSGAEMSRPFHGYYMRIITSQGKQAPGGKYNYVINGNMIGGFALVAWPAEHGQSGIMTFIVNQQGRVYQKDLGTKTAKIVRSMKEYDPGDGWVASPD
jgi:hypothetical protein